MRKYKLLICIFVCISIISGILFINRYKIKNQILIWLDRRLDYERSLDVGDEFNKVAWGNLRFQINHYKEGNRLEYVDINSDFAILDENAITLLEGVTIYKFEDDRLYVVASDGYAVIYGDNTGKLYTTTGKYDDLEGVEQISSFDDFDLHEQGVLKRLSQ